MHSLHLGRIATDEVVIDAEPAQNSIHVPIRLVRKESIVGGYGKWPHAETILQQMKRVNAIAAAGEGDDHVVLCALVTGTVMREDLLERIGCACVVLVQPVFAVLLAHDALAIVVDEVFLEQQATPSTRDQRALLDANYGRLTLS